MRQQKGSGIGNISSREAALRDVVVDRLKKSGVDVVTDVEEAQRLLDEANGERLSQDKKEHLKPSPPLAMKGINKPSFQVLMVQRYLKILIN